MGKLPVTPSGAASATSDSSMVSPMMAAQTPEMSKQEKGPEVPVTKDVSASNPPHVSDVFDTDPVRGIIRSQTGQDRRLPHPREFSTQAPPHESMYPQNRALEHPYHSASTSRPEEITAQPATTRQIMQQSEAATNSSGGYLPAISHPGGTTT